MKPLARAILLAAVVASLAACGGAPALPDVKPWQKGILAKPEMTFDTDHLEARYNEHTYFSKEAASGGAGIGGGGCGCN